jgi:hypothetical protein
VRRQLLHYEKMNLPNDVEILYIDDGSDPPLSANGCKLNNFSIFATNDKRAWTQPIARNLGVKMAKGVRVLCTDIDHILTKELVNFVLESKYDYIKFRREVAILDENGDVTQDIEILKSYGFPQDRIDRRGFHISPHGNSYVMPRELFLKLGGGREDRITTYPNQEEVPLRGKIRRMWRRGELSMIPDDERPLIYHIPNGHYCGDMDYNPFGLFHNTSRRQFLNEFKRR